ncbi:hypothetical protein YC2023_050721 [Brassica napus]
MASLLIHRNFCLLDGYMNIVMTQTEQYVNGQLKINIDWSPANCFSNIKKERESGVRKFNGN